MKKKILILFLAVICCNMTFAQDKRIFIFEKFTNAKIKLNPRGITTYSMNYDASGGKMYFMQGNVMMELTNTLNIDTISWGKRKFIPSLKRFLEVYSTPHGKIYIDWVIKDLIIGKKGAYGLRTEGNVQSLRLFDFSAQSGISAFTKYDTQNTYSNDILKRKNENIYYIDLMGERKKIKSVKQLEKTFLTHKQEIQKYQKDHSIDFNDVEQALEIIEYCMAF